MWGMWDTISKTAQGCGQTEKLENKHHSAKKTYGKTRELIKCVYLTCLFVI